MRFGETRRLTALQCAEHDLLFRCHYSTVVTYLARRVPIEEAKDLAADVFLEAWRQRDNVVIDDDRGWLPWLFTVARRKSTAWRAARNAHAAKEARAAWLPAEDFVERIVEVDAADQRLRATLDALVRLDAEDRDVLELCGLFGFTPAQAAITLGVPASTARVRLHRARGRLADLVAAESSGEEVS